MVYKMSLGIFFLTFNLATFLDGHRHPQQGFAHLKLILRELRLVGDVVVDLPGLVKSRLEAVLHHRIEVDVHLLNALNVGAHHLRTLQLIGQLIIYSTTKRDKNVRQGQTAAGLDLIKMPLTSPLRILRANSVALTKSSGSFGSGTTFFL